MYKVHRTMTGFLERHRSFLVLVGFVPLFLLSACAGTGATPAAGIDDESRTAKIDRALERAGDTPRPVRESLSALEAAYKRNSDDPALAVRYARALRAEGQINKAVIILSPFARKENALSDVSSEFAAVHLEMGDYETAEKFARAAIVEDPSNYGAFQSLGIALDARGYHKQAEVAFRKGLDVWKGDPTSIMNNLALNLVNQGMLDEASEILQRAAAENPGKPEIERNLRIVLALKQSTPPSVAAAAAASPKPAPKPESKPKN